MNAAPWIIHLLAERDRNDKSPQRPYAVYHEFKDEDTEIHYLGEFSGRSLYHAARLAIRQYGPTIGSLEWLKIYPAAVAGIQQHECPSCYRRWPVHEADECFECGDLASLPVTTWITEAEVVALKGGAA